MYRLLFDAERWRDWLKFSFDPFWYGILGMPSGSGRAEHDCQTSYDY